MASELRVNTLKDASGNNSVATSFVAGGSAKAWVHLTGSGTPTAEDSLNNGSVTDGGTGLYTFNFTSNFGNIHYCDASMAGTAGEPTAGRHQMPNAELTASAFQVRNIYGTNSVQDDANVFIIFHGDLA